MGMDYLAELGNSGLLVHQGGNFLNYVRSMRTEQMASQDASFI